MTQIYYTIQWMDDVAYHMPHMIWPICYVMVNANGFDYDPVVQ